MTAPVQVGPSTGGPTPLPDWDDLFANIGARIHAERTARGWSQERLGKQASMTKDQIRRLESGLIAMRNLLAACWAMGVEAGYLLSDQWQAPVRRPTLALRQVEVLQEAASGRTLEQVGARLGMSAQNVSTVLSRTYARLGVDGLPRDQKRSAAVRVAVEYGLITLPNRTS